MAGHEAFSVAASFATGAGAQGVRHVRRDGGSSHCLDPGNATTEHFTPINPWELAWRQTVIEHETQASRRLTGLARGLTV